MLRKTCFLPVIFLLANLCASAQVPTQTQRTRVDSFGIRGKVIIPNQSGMEERLEVRLEKSALQVIQTTYTDSSGNFDFRNLGPGSYYIAVTLDGFDPVHQLVEIFNNFGTTSVTILMNRPAVEFKERPSGLDAADPDVVDVNQMKENFPKKAVQNYEKALEERRKGHLENAVKLLEEAIEIAPSFFHAHNNLGILYQSLKRYDDAEREYRKSHELSARTERPLVNLGSLYIERSNLVKRGDDNRGILLDAALDALEEAVRLNPRSAVAEFLLGQANYRSDFWEEAETAFKKAYELDPEMEGAQLMLANVYMRLKKWQDVLDTLNAYISENPNASDLASIENMRDRIAKDLSEANGRTSQQ